VDAVSQRYKRQADAYDKVKKKGSGNERTTEAVNLTPKQIKEFGIIEE